MIALKLVLFFMLALHGRFVMDEFGQLGYAKYLGNGLFDTVQPPKAVGFAVFYKLAHVLGWDARSVLIIGRLQTALLGCATLAVIYACARALGQNRVRALAVVLVLLCFSNFIERAYRTIAEPLALFFAATALLVIVRTQVQKPHIIVAAGVLSGLSFLATQKAVYFNVALGFALVTAAALSRRYRQGVVRGAWLVLGWSIPVVAYCVLFGGKNFIAIAETLVFGPVEVASRGGREYGGLRHFVGQTVFRNVILYVLCLGGLLLQLRRIRNLSEPPRIAILFTLIITLLVFAHDQPWPYVFIMALPFLSLWCLVPLDHIAARHVRAAVALLVIAIAISFARNIQHARLGNADQLALVERAESLLAPGEIYFDGIGMLPTRAEPSTLWLDRFYVLKTLRERERSEAYRIFHQAPPKVILWTYRMDAIAPVVAPLIRDSYVKVAPNVRLAGRWLQLREPARFTVSVAGRYGLFTRNGDPVEGLIEVNGELHSAPVSLSRGTSRLVLRSGAGEALLLPVGDYRGRFETRADNRDLFAAVYD